MTYAALFALVVSTWTLVHLAAAWQRASRSVVSESPSATDVDGASFVGRAAMPLLCLGVAWGVDRVARGAGTFVVAGLHLVLLAAAGTSVVRTVVRRHDEARRAS